MAEFFKNFEVNEKDVRYLTCIICQTNISKDSKISSLDKHLKTKKHMKKVSSKTADHNFPNSTKPSKKFKIEEVILRFPHIGEAIFDHLDDQSLTNCKEVARSLYNFLGNQKFPWIRVIQKYVKESNENYTQCPRKWKRMFQKTNVEQIQTLVEIIQKYIAQVEEANEKFESRNGYKFNYSMHKGEGFDLLQFIVSYGGGTLEIIKNIWEVEGLNYKEEKALASIVTTCNNSEVTKFIINSLMDKTTEKDIFHASLQRSAIVGRFENFKLFFESSKEKNPTDSYGQTPLHKAASNCNIACNVFEKPCTHWKICHFIISNIEEKDKKTMDDDGFTALDLATKSNFKPIMDLLSDNNSGNRK